MQAQRLRKPMPMTLHLCYVHNPPSITVCICPYSVSMPKTNNHTAVEYAVGNVLPKVLTYRLQNS